MKCFFRLMALGFTFLLADACGPNLGEGKEGGAESPDKLQDELRDYVDRFNALINDVRDAKPTLDKVDKYFYVYKSVARVEEAKYIIFAEVHVHSASQIWTYGLINKMLREGDRILFEGYRRGVSVPDVRKKIMTDLFAVREFEKRKLDKNYIGLSIYKISKKFQPLYKRALTYLHLNNVRFKTLIGHGWDSPGDELSRPVVIKRNKSMVMSLEDEGQKGRALLITGGYHTPPYEFARSMSYIKKENNLWAAFKLTKGADKHVLNEAFYEFAEKFASYKPKKTYLFGTTKPIYDFLKDKDYAILIPRNLPGFNYLEKSLPSQ